jgi:chromosomal replication initiation ATPase DnaA
MVVEQPALPLGYRPRLGLDDFCVSASNEHAFQWLAAPADWPMPRTLLVGPKASGKTHLAAVFASRQAATIIDDADDVADGEPLFHAWNAASRDCPLLLTASRLPRAWAHRLPDLASRLAATPLVRIDDPDDALIGAVLAKRFADRGLRVGSDVIAYLVMRIERSFDAMAATVAALDTLALAERREITVPLARQVLDGQLPLAL